jgi:hypothetical protein
VVAPLSHTPCRRCLRLWRLVGCSGKCAIGRASLITGREAVVTSSNLWPRWQARTSYKKAETALTPLWQRRSR